MKNGLPSVSRNSASARRIPRRPSSWPTTARKKAAMSSPARPRSASRSTDASRRRSAKRSASGCVRVRSVSRYVATTTMAAAADPRAM